MTLLCRAERDLEALGFVAAKVQRWSRKLRRRCRLLGLADLLGVRDRQALLVCLSSDSWGRAEAEQRALATLPAALTWLSAAGHALEVWYYHRRGRRHALHRLPVLPSGEKDAQLATGHAPTVPCQHLHGGLVGRPGVGD